MQSFKNLKVSVKLTGAFILLAAIVALVGNVGRASTVELGGRVQSMKVDVIDAIVSLRETERQMMLYRGDVWKLLAERDVDHPQPLGLVVDDGQPADGADAEHEHEPPRGAPRGHPGLVGLRGRAPALLSHVARLGGPWSGAQAARVGRPPLLWSGRDHDEQTMRAASGFGRLGA